MPSIMHGQLVAAGVRWLKRQGFGVVVSEITVHGTPEQPDVIGFRSTCSCVIEAKASRADFLRDQAKPHRTEGGLGNYRFFICPTGMLSVADMPGNWGLLHWDGHKIAEVARPMGNIWPAFCDANDDNWRAFRHWSDPALERAVLYSIARRMPARGTT